MRADALERRKRIIAVAREILTTGTDLCSLDEIAKRAGVGVATLYRNFPDRVSLISTIVEQIFGQIVDVQQRALDTFPTDPERAWQEYTSGLIDLGLAPLASSYTAEMVARIRPDVENLLADLVARNEQIVNFAKEAGLVSPAVSGVFFLRGLLSVARPHHRGVLQTEEQFTEKLVATYLVGLRHVE